jgi:transposase-like protein
MFLLRGFDFTHEAVRDWEERFDPLLAEHIRGKRKGKVGRRWYVDEMYKGEVKVVLSVPGH